jgi:putative Mg2+ transporter-C (MgtC) family protein
MPTSLDLDLAVRLLVAAILGAAIGLEREARGHEAGMRTHLLVAEGAALFTVLSIYGFGPIDGSGAPDPSRVAAQVVSGVGFLGAGAIVKFGINVRGLTTAASLWAVAAVGMAAGAAAYVTAVTATAIVLLSLGPLKAVADRLRLPERQAFRVQVALEEGVPVRRLTDWFRANGAEIRHLDVERGARGRLDVDARVKLPRGLSPVELLSRVEEVDGLSLTESGGHAE